MSFRPLDYAHDGQALTGLLALPVGVPRAAVIVFPTIWNSTPAVEAKANGLADAGYAAMIADFYGAAPVGQEEAQDWAGRLRSDTGFYRSRLYAAVDRLAAEVPGIPMLAIGFCMGGQAALELARDGADLKAVASFHGLLDTTKPAQSGAVRPRILVCHGLDDPLADRDAVLEFWREMDAAGADYHFHAYGGVRHGFTNPASPSGNEVVAFDESADRQSWRACLSFFDETLAPAT